MEKTHHIRRSQFVLTYGPGAIIESRNGPRLIPSLNRGLDGELLSPEKLKNFEITDSRLRTILKNMGRSESRHETRIFSLPSNASLGKPDNIPIYITYIFPVWKICYNKDEHPEGRYILHHEKKCPVCNKEKHSSPVRFVVACNHGHLDEVPWNYAVHRGEKSENCRPRYFYWKTGGSSLSDIIVECPECGSKTSMQEMYQLEFNCTARHPEKEYPKPSSGKSSPFYAEPKRPRTCNGKMKIIQRQSSSLRFPETITLLTIPKYDNSISNILQRPDIVPVIGMLLSSEEIDEEKLINKIESSSSYIPGEAPHVIIDYVKKNGINSLHELFHDLHNEERTFMDFIYEEFESLLEGSRISDDGNFSMSPPKSLSGINGIIPPLFIYPIDILRTVTAQYGYIRMPSSREEPEIVKSGVFLGDSIWYPGFEGMGEGLFITFSDKPPDIKGMKAYEEWENHKNSFSMGNPLWNDVYGQPLFVWLHTISHSIIKALSLHSGYSSASLRERVYIDRKGQNGGILIYTTSPGEDGSMGGLVGAVDKFDHIMRRAVENIKVCSNDPLCGEVRKNRDRANGGACYSCLLISETSCEHRNMALDRHMVLGD